VPRVLVATLVALLLSPAAISSRTVQNIVVPTVTLLTSYRFVN
jgi:hypothetical protein